MSLNAPAGDDLAEWEAYLREAVPDGLSYSGYADDAPADMKPAHKRVYAYKRLNEEYARDTLHRPTEYDAIASLIAGHLLLCKSVHTSAFSGTDTNGYYKRQPVTEREQLALVGMKRCSNSKCEHGVLDHAFFYRNRSRADGYDHLCMHCRRAENRKAGRSLSAVA